MTSARLITSFATALLLVAGLGYLASQTLLGRPELVTQQPAYVGAPSPQPATQPATGAAGNDKKAGAPVGPIQVDPGWITTTAAAAGIPEPAVRAYATAQLAAPADCEIGWTTLAGIGWVESHHGTIDGRTLGADGHSSTPILGPALNGKGEFAAIPASPASSAWHGDPHWDHAVGPLQFIPSSWETWAADGDGDGVSDPNDLDDAALAAVGYLCADGHDLTTGQGWADAVFSYNHAQSYIDAVHTAATAYAERTG